MPTSKSYKLRVSGATLSCTHLVSQIIFEYSLESEIDSLKKRKNGGGDHGRDKVSKAMQT